MDNTNFFRFLELPAELRVAVYGHYFDIVGDQTSFRDVSDTQTYLILPSDKAKGSCNFYTTPISAPRLSVYPPTSSVRRWSDVTALLMVSKGVRDEAIWELQRFVRRSRLHLSISGAPAQLFTSSANSICADLRAFDLYVPTSIYVWRDMITTLLKPFMDSRGFESLDLLFRRRGRITHNTVLRLQAVRCGGDVELTWPDMPLTHKHRLAHLGGDYGDLESSSNFVIEWRQHLTGVSDEVLEEAMDEILDELLDEGGN